MRRITIKGSALGGSLQEVFQALHQEATSSGEVDFEIAMALLNKSSEKHIALGVQRLEASAAKKYPQALFTLAMLCIEGRRVTADLARGYRLLAESAAESTIANAKYMLALLILKAKEVGYSAERTSTLIRSVGEWRSSTAEKVATNKLLESQDVLDALRQYDNPAGIAYAKKLLGDCGAEYKPANELLTEMSAREAKQQVSAPASKINLDFLMHPESLQSQLYRLAFGGQSRVERKKPAEERKVDSSRRSAEVKSAPVTAGAGAAAITPPTTSSASGPASVHADVDSLSALKTIYSMVYDMDAPAEEVVATKLREQVAALKDAPRSEVFWKLIRDGFTSGCGELFLTKLQEYGAYAVLFPPTVSSISEDQQQANDAWLKARVKLIDTRYEEGMHSFYASMVAAMLVTKELPEQSTAADVQRVHAAYQVPFHCDAAFERHVAYMKGRKRQFLRDEYRPSQQDSGVERRVVPSV